MQIVTGTYLVIYQTGTQILTGTYLVIYQTGMQIVTGAYLVIYQTGMTTLLTACYLLDHAFHSMFDNTSRGNSVLDR